MGQYYEIFNLTRREVVNPARGVWKWGEFNLEQIMLVTKWSKLDTIIALGDYGDKVTLYKSRNNASEKFNGNFKKIYICEFTNCLLDKEYTEEEYKNLFREYIRSKKESKQ